MEDFDFSQEYNDVRYFCNDCGSSWKSLEFLEEYKSNYNDYDGFVKGDWHKIKRSIFENLFRPQSRQIGITCPKCSLKEKSSGNIEITVTGRKNEQEKLESAYLNNEMAFEKAMSNLWHDGKEVDSEGLVVESD